MISKYGVVTIGHEEYDVLYQICDFFQLLFTLSLKPKTGPGEVRLIAKPVKPGEVVWTVRHWVKMKNSSTGIDHSYAPNHSLR